MHTRVYRPTRLESPGTCSATSDEIVTFKGASLVLPKRLDSDPWAFSSIYVALGSSVLGLALSVLATWRSSRRGQGAIVLS